jgi:hypothetical protein
MAGDRARGGVDDASRGGRHLVQAVGAVVDGFAGGFESGPEHAGPVLSSARLVTGWVPLTGQRVLADDGPAARPDGLGELTVHVGQRRRRAGDQRVHPGEGVGVAGGMRLLGGGLLLLERDELADDLGLGRADLFGAVVEPVGGLMARPHRRRQPPVGADVAVPIPPRGVGGAAVEGTKRRLGGAVRVGPKRRQVGCRGAPRRGRRGHRGLVGLRPPGAGNGGQVGQFGRKLNPHDQPRRPASPMAAWPVCSACA